MNIDMFIDELLKHSPALIVAIPLLGAFLTPLISRIHKKVRNIFVITIAGITGFLVSMLSYDVLIEGNRHFYEFGTGDVTNEAITQPIVRILFAVDGLNAFMIIIGAILLFVAVIYSWSFMKENTGLDKYYTLILLMSAGMFGMMLTGDMFNFFVFLEITSIASCALIAFRTNKAKAVTAGFKYIVISTIGALFILLAIAILYGQYNALNMYVIAGQIEFGFLDRMAFVLLIAGLAMKAGIVPMHMWLPDAYGRAPAPVAIILVGTTQAGLYAFLRMTFSVYGNSLQYYSRQITIIKDSISFDITLHGVLGTIIVILAIFTIIIGVLMALKQSNLKRIIAFAAVAEIGYMMLAIGAAFLSFEKFQIESSGTTTTYIVMSTNGMMALKGGIFHIINDALDIGLLFLVAGALYYATKETSINRMGGLARNMKYTTIFFIIGLLAVSGMPPMNGFASKLMIYQSAFYVNPILGIIAVLCSILLLAVFIKIFHAAFLGPPIPRFKDVKEVPKSMLISMAILACIIIFFGLFPNLIVDKIIEPAANALLTFGGI